MSDDIKKAIQAHLLNLEKFQHEKIYARVELLVDRDKPPQEI